METSRPALSATHPQARQLKVELERANILLGEERQALEEALQKLRRHDRSQAEFIINVSHELKTPLTAMLHTCRNLLKGIAGPVTPGVEEYLAVFDRECQRMLKTVNDILDLRKREIGGLTVNRIRIPVRRFIRRAVDAFQAAATARRIRLTWLEDSAAGCVQCDPEEIMRIVNNIVDNAIKFSPEGSTVSLWLTPGEPADQQIVLSVEDEGPGISEEALKRVTDPYFKADEHPTGAGLGLTIARELVELHHGRLTLVSPVPGRTSGTRVEIVFPTAPPPLVLIVDDESLVRMTLSVQLEDGGYRTARAENGVEALKIAREQKPDMMIVDLILQEMNGCDLIMEIKSDPELRTTPIMSITGGNIDAATRGILKSFMIPTMYKPWEEAELFDQVETALIGTTVFRR